MRKRYLTRGLGAWSAVFLVLALTSCEDSRPSMADSVDVQARPAAKSKPLAPKSTEQVAEQSPEPSAQELPTKALKLDLIEPKAEAGSEEPERIAKKSIAGRGGETRESRRPRAREMKESKASDLERALNTDVFGGFGDEDANENAVNLGMIDDGEAPKARRRPKGRRLASKEEKKRPAPDQFVPKQNKNEPVIDLFGAAEADTQVTGSKRQAPKPITPSHPLPVPSPAGDDLARGVGGLLQALDFGGFENRVQEQPPAPIRTDMVDTKVDPMSTFSVDVDTGGYALARARLRAGYRPKPEDVRLEEFLNYFAYDYAPPKEGEFSIHMEAAPDPLAEAKSQTHIIRIGVKGKTVPDDARPPAHLTFLIDVSGSMFGPDRLGLVIESLDLVTRNLRPDDTLALVTYAKGAHVRLWPAGASERDIIASTIAAMEPGGSSALDDGLKLAYEVASTHFYAGHINRVVLMGDGKANVGATQPEALLRSIQVGVEDGVMLSTVGFGAKSFNDRMMEQLADRGNGNYFFVDSYREAVKVFSDRLCGTLFAIAKDVKIQVEFNPESVLRHRLLGYENRRLEHHEFRDDAVDAGEVGAGHSVTALYEVVLAPTPARTLATVRVRYKKPDESAASETVYELFSEEVRKDVREASPDFKFATAVAKFAEIAKGSEKGGADRLSLIQEIASEGVKPEEQPDRSEFLALLTEAAPYYTR